MNSSGTSNGTWRMWTEEDILTWHSTEVALLPLVMLVGIVGNGLVFYVNHFRLPSNTDTLFKRILAIIDLIDLSLSVPTLFYLTVVPESPVYVPCCRFVAFISIWAALFAGYVLAVISIDRYLKLCLLRKSGLETGQVKKIMVALTLVSTVTIIPTLLLYTKNTTYFIYYQAFASYCFMDFMTSMWSLLIVFSVALAVSFFAICAVLVVLYLKIILKLRELSAKHSQLKGPESSSADATKGNSRQSDAMRKSSLVFIAVTVAFFACYTPYFISLMLQATNLLIEGFLSPELKVVLDLAKLSPLVSHVINPLIYLASSDQLGKEIKDIFMCKTSARDCFRRQKGPQGAVSRI